MHEEAAVAGWGGGSRQLEVRRCIAARQRGAARGEFGVITTVPIEKKFHRRCGDSRSSACTNTLFTNGWAARRVVFPQDCYGTLLLRPS
eukprot:scaffold38980_cov49-Phaeocystis_antarctica.AAC.1